MSRRHTINVIECGHGGPPAHRGGPRGWLPPTLSGPDTGGGGGGVACLVVAACAYAGIGLLYAAITYFFFTLHILSC